MASENVPLNRGANSLLKKLKGAQVRNANVRARSGAKPSSGTLTSPERIGSAKKPPVRKINVPALRRGTEPANVRKTITAVTEYRKPSTAVTEYRKPSRGVVPYKGGGGRLAHIADEAIGSTAGTVAKRLFGVLGGPAIELAAMTEPTNVGESEWIADKKNRGPLMKGNASQKLSSGPRDDRASSGGTPYKRGAQGVPKITSTPFTEKRQGTEKATAPTKKAALATDKSRLNKGTAPAKKSLGRMLGGGGTQTNVPAGPRGYGGSGNSRVVGGIRGNLAGQGGPAGGVRTGAKTGTSAGADRKFKFKDIFK